LLKLVRAAWAAGFRSGRENGSDEATAYEHGSRSFKPQEPEKAWQEDVQWRIDTDTSCHLDVSNPDAWDDVP